MLQGDDERRQLVKLRDRLLETRSWPEGVQVRPEIANSWWRCLLSGVQPDRIVPKHEPNVQREGQFWRAAQAVLAKRCDQLGDSPVSLVLADRDGRLMECVSPDSALRRKFDDIGIEPGVVLDEAIAGTNATGTVLEDRQPIRISGAEHFVSPLHGLSCVGVPIMHPVTRQLRGVISVACRNEDASDLLLPFVADIAAEIERRLREGSSLTERLLLDRFLRVKNRSNRPIISLNDQVIISNPAAVRILGEVGQAMLWEHASQAILSRQGRSCELSLSSGEILATRCDPIVDGTAVIGALIEIDAPRPSVRPARSRDGGGGGTERSIAGLAGRSARWREVCDEAAESYDRRDSIVLVGEAGVGKLALVENLFAEERAAGRLSVLDAALEPIEGAAAWITALRCELPNEERVVVLRHVHLLDDVAAQALCGLIDSGMVRAHLVATATQAEAGGAYRRLMGRLAVAPIKVPPLREHLEDLPDLLAALTRKHTTAGAKVRWLPDAVQTLTRLEWPGNIGQLENLVRQVLASCRSGYISAKDLPEDVRREAPRRRLSHLERVELDAIIGALRQAAGNKSEAADHLGISRATLYRRIRAFGLDLGKAAF